MANEEKYRWHDLRKDEDDVPSKEHCNILAQDQFGDHQIISAFDLHEHARFYLYHIGIIAWKYIKPFEKEEKEE